jgi:gliding motility-associated-like protein
LGADTYHCTVTDSNGCSKSAEIVILEPDPLSVNAVLNNPSCPGLDDGSIIPTPGGGSGAGYEYIWSNGVYQRFNTDIPAGTYILTMNDDNNCVLIDTFNVEDPDTVEITSLVTTDVTCLGRTDGTITITAEGGTGVFNYSTNGGLTFDNSPVASDVAAGEYEVIVTDENDCASETYPVTLSVDDTVAIETLNAINPNCLGVDNGTLEITASGGSGIYEYCADGGTNFVTTPVISSLSAGEYQVVVRDDNDCTSEIMPVSLSFSDTVRIIEIEKSDLSCSGLPDGSITITASGGSGSYQYSENGGESFGSEANIGSLAEGSYSVVVKDDNECLSEENEITLISTDVCGLIIYDGFSPNNDGKNEVWNIGNYGSFPNIKVKIFNLWGKLVFSSDGYDTPWDGTFNGKELPSGTYYYVIDPGDGSDVITGDVSIVK